jgi:hypothetical protein
MKIKIHNPKWFLWDHLRDPEGYIKMLTELGFSVELEKGREADRLYHARGDVYYDMNIEKLMELAKFFYGFTIEEDGSIRL